MDNSTANATDFALKYQKLASEYSKLRTHTAVLKKAVAEEQSKNADLKEILQEKDQIMRKLEQEIECLNFRNMQLTKRVSILQDDLCSNSDEKFKLRKIKSSNSPKVEEKSILDEELQNRIEENEKLHQQVYNSELEQKKLVEDLSEELLHLKAEAIQQEAKYSENLNAKDLSIQKLTEEHAKIEIRLRNLEKELIESREQESICREDLEKVEKELGEKLSSALLILQERLPFIDSRDVNLMNLDCPVFVMQYWRDVNSCLSLFGSNLIEFLRKMSDLHMYMEEQMQNFIKCDLSSITESNVLRKFLEHLHEHPTYLKAIEESFMSFLSKSQNNSTLLWSNAFTSSIFVNNVSKYVSYLQKLLPYITFCLQIKYRLTEAIPRLAACLHSLDNLTFKVIRAFSRIERWLFVLSRYDILKQNGRVTGNLNYIFQRLVLSVEYLLEIFNDVKKQLSYKIAIEDELLTVTVEMKNTDKCILSCLVAIVNILEKMVSDVPKDDIFKSKNLFGPLRNTACVNGAVTGFKNRARKYLNMIEDVPPKEIPYCLAIQNVESMNNYVENQELLRHQLHALETKVTKLEQEKEHWMLECQLLQTKQKREFKFDSSKDEITESDLENCVREYIQTLVIKLQLADTKAVSYQSECSALYHKIQTIDDDCSSCKKELIELKSNNESLKENIQETVNNYENQLQSMTEHISTMNDKLTTQKEEIDCLKHSNAKKLKSK